MRKICHTLDCLLFFSQKNPKKKKKTKTHKRTYTHNLLSLLIFCNFAKKGNMKKEVAEEEEEADMTTYMAIAKGGEGKKPPGTSMGASNRSSTGYTHQDE